MLAAIFLAAGTASVAAAELPAQKSTVGGVTVTVSPQNLTSHAKTWDFKIVLDRHSRDLSDDLMKTAMLLDDTGGGHMPVSWEGAGPGDHHREGIVRFKPLKKTPAAIALQLMRPGEPEPRIFRWNLR